jgi:DNA-binding response OmpR family regulator
MKNNKNDPEYRLEVISDSPTFYLLIEKFVKLSYSNIQLQVWDSLPMIHESLNKQPSDLIILDGIFTQNSSIDLMYTIRFNLRIITPIWFFSVIETPEFLLKAREVGANRIIERPFDPIEIAAEICHYLKQKNLVEQS